MILKPRLFEFYFTNKEIWAQKLSNFPKAKKTKPGLYTDSESAPVITYALLLIKSHEAGWQQHMEAS